MNSISTSKNSANTMGNYAFAGSLVLHAVFIAVFSAWQWNLPAPEISTPKTIHVTFITAPSTSGPIQNHVLSQPAVESPTQPAAVRSVAITSHQPRTPKIIRRVTSSSKMNRKSLILPQPVVLKSERPSLPVNSISLPAKGQKTIHQRAPALNIHDDKTTRTVGQTAYWTGPMETRTPVVARRPHPVHTLSTPPSAVQPVSQSASDHSSSQNAVEEKYAALPGDFSDILPAEDGKAGVDLDLLRGTFTGQVRKRIAEAKYYPRMARRRGMEGQPVILFTLDKQGHLKNVDLALTSGYQPLDQAALEAVHKGAPYPEIPAALMIDSIQFKLPISFVLK